MINDIFSDLDGYIKSALYADDGAIWMRGRNETYVLENIRKAIGKVDMWSFKWGFKISTSKSCYMVFTNKRKCHVEKLFLYQQPMEKVNEFKYLGLWFDSKYTRKTQIKQLETKCKQVINLLRAVVGCDWGADKQSLIDIYRACMRSSIDYGCIVYDAAAKTTLEKLINYNTEPYGYALEPLRQLPLTQYS